MPPSNALTIQGITAAKAGDRAAARQLFDLALQHDPQDVQAWLWRSAVVESDAEQLVCLQQVLRIDPQNTAAAKGIARLVTEGKVDIRPLTPAAPPPPESAGPPQPPPAPARRAAETTLFAVKPALLPTLIGLGLITPLYLFLLFALAVPAASAARSDDTLIYLLAALVWIAMFGPLFRRLVGLLFTTYTLTTEHLIVESGMLSKYRKTIPIHKIQDVAFQQSLLERPFKIGDVIVESAGERGAIHLLDLTDCRVRTAQILSVVQGQE